MQKLPILNEQIAFRIPQNMPADSGKMNSRFPKTDKNTLGSLNWNPLTGLTHFDLIPNRHMKAEKTHANGKSICNANNDKRKSRKLRPTGKKCRGTKTKLISKLKRKQRKTQKKKQNKNIQIKLNLMMTSIKNQPKMPCSNRHGEPALRASNQSESPNSFRLFGAKKQNFFHPEVRFESPVDSKFNIKIEQADEAPHGDIFSTPPLKPKGSRTLCRPVQKTTYKRPQINWIKLKNQIGTKVPKKSNTFRLFQERPRLGGVGPIGPALKKGLERSKLFESNSSEFGQMDKFSNLSKMQELVNPKIINPNVISYSPKQSFDLSKDVSQIFSRSPKKPQRARLPSSIQLFPRQSPAKASENRQPMALFTPKVQRRIGSELASSFLSPESGKKTKKKNFGREKNLFRDIIQM